MQQLSRWMRAVGVFYILNGLALMLVYLVPSAQRAMISQVVPGADAGDPLVAYAMEIWLMFALEVTVVGVFVLLGSRDAWANRILVLTVIGLELIRGVLDDLVWITNGYPPAIYFAWIIVHAAIIITGVLAFRSAYFERQVDGLFPGMAPRDRATVTSIERGA
jgi:hypothetical protein